MGETTSAQLQLYLLNRVQRVSGFQLTSFPADGFSVGKMVEGQRRQTQVGNAVYTMIPLVFPIRAIKNGAMALGPVTANVVLDLPSGGGRGSLFEQFGFRDPFDTKQEQLTLVCGAQPLQLLPLPRANIPPNFNGAVGSYSMTFTAGPTNVTAGDPITVKVQISGRGSLDSRCAGNARDGRGTGHFPKSDLTAASSLAGHCS